MTRVPVDGEERVEQHQLEGPYRLCESPTFTCRRQCRWGVLHVAHELAAWAGLESLLVGDEGRPGSLRSCTLNNLDVCPSAIMCVSVGRAALLCHNRSTALRCFLVGTLAPVFSISFRSVFTSWQKLRTVDYIRSLGPRSKSWVDKYVRRWR